MPTTEANFDGLVGQTHNYAGLSPGNLASAANSGAVANPRKAARQGLAKMRAVRDMGFTQGVIPPLDRPDVGFLRSLGFGGDEGRVIARAALEAPDMLAAACAASSMWTANAATVSPGADTTDGRVHLTPANLISNLHRAIEAPTTTRLLRAIFAGESRFAVHDPLPGAPTLGDEGAANHTRFCAEYGESGVEFFVYGRTAEWDHDPEKRLGLGPTRHPARQTREASQAIARRHGLAPDRVVFAQQSPAVIDAGVFHNDVISVGNRNFLFHHEDAFVDTPRVVGELRARVAEVCGVDLVAVCVPASAVSVEEAVRTYLFNSQLLSVGEGGGGEMVLVAPEECRESESVSACLDALVSGEGPIREVRHFDLRQSMRNGGGPACLRLRVVLSDADLEATNPKTLLTDELYETLDGWIERHYREELVLSDLADPALVRESRQALDELTRIMGLGDIYSFQRG